MKTYQELLEGSVIKEYKVYKIKDIFWIAYAEGSGIALPLKNRSYITDKKDDKNVDFDFIRNILMFAKLQKPLKKNKNLSLYELPIHESDRGIWDGSRTTKNKEYFILSTGKINVVTFFKKKTEALAWIKNKF